MNYAQRREGKRGKKQTERSREDYILKLAKDIQDTVPDSEVKSAAPRRTFEDAENVQLHLDLCESHC